LPPTKEAITRAVDEVKRLLAKRNFKQSIELAVKLRDIDLKKPENRINELIELPNAIEKNVRICMIAGGDLALRAKKGGSDLVIGKEELAKLAEEKKAVKKLSNEYDFFVAEAQLMPLVGKTLGANLGPKGKMPTPALPGTDVEDVFKRLRKTVRVRVRDQPLIQCRVGTEDMATEKIVENIHALLTRIESKLDRGAKNMEWINLKSTMGNSVIVPTTAS